MKFSSKGLILGLLPLLFWGLIWISKSEYRENQHKLQITAEQLAEEIWKLHQNDLKQENDVYSLKKLQGSCYKLIQNLNENSEQEFQHLGAVFNINTNILKCIISRRVNEKNHSALIEVQLPKWSEL